MRNRNIEIFQDTWEAAQNGFYHAGERRVPLKLTQAQMEYAKVYLPQDVAAIGITEAEKRVPFDTRCAYSCVNEDSFSHALHLSKSCPELLDGCNRREVLVLNLANPVNPGGGVRKGSKAQEEDLCRRSTLLRSLEGPCARGYYAYNRSLNTFMGSHAIVMTPQVEVFKDMNGEPLEESAVVAVMTCAAPMITYGMEGLTQEEYRTMVYERIVGMLRCAAHWGYGVLVLGAFGCGAFSNDARIVSDLFYEALCHFEYQGMTADEVFRRIDFAVLSREGRTYNFDEFSRNFSDFYREGKGEE